MNCSSFPPQDCTSWKKGHYLILVIGLVLLIAVSACQASAVENVATPSPPSATATLMPEPSLTPLPPKTATVAALIAREAGGLRIMTYNVYVGGSLNSGPGAKVDLLISIIKTYNPDLLGIQEANGWDQDDFAIADRVASELGMNYVYCKTTAHVEDGDQGQSFDTIIMSKFPIVDSETYPEIPHCFGRAEVLLPDGQSLQVFNLHVPYGYCQEFFPELLDITEPYLSGPALLMGDFNVIDPDWFAAGKGYGAGMNGCPEIMEESDWVWLSGNFVEGKIDQIWVSPPLGSYHYITMYHRSEFLVHYSDIGEASDHRPVAADIFFP